MSVPAPGRSPDEVTAQIVAFVNEQIMAEHHPIGADDGLEQAGVDSMALLRVLVFVEKCFGVRIPDEDLTEEVIASPRSLAHHVCGRAAVA